MIARALSRAEKKTVKTHISSLLAKLGMQRRTQAAVFGTRSPKLCVSRAARGRPRRLRRRNRS